MNTNNNRATHFGTCQLCGSLQKAEKGSNRIAAHGYTLAHGWQAGTCTGSGQLPFEVCKVYAEAVLASYKKQVAEFVATPRPENTAKNRWEKCPEIAAWQLAQNQQNARKSYIFWAEPRAASWAPSVQKTVREVEAVEASAKATRVGIRALSGAVKIAKRNLSKFGELFRSVLDEKINGALYIERKAFWDSLPVNGCVVEWPRYSELVDIPRFATNVVTKFVKLARNNGDSELILGAEKLESLSEAYEKAKKAYAEAKA